MDELAGRSAIVTGASRGIGAATAKELASQGVAVILAARTFNEIEAIAAEICDAGGKAEALACDVSSYDDVAAAVTRCQEAFGGLDIMVNNAGVIEPIGRLADSDPELWVRAADINFKGVYHGLRAAVPVMATRGVGVIVNVSSGAATGVREGWSHYCAAKAAALSLTRCADLECRDQGIRVVGLSPGTVATEMQVLVRLPASIRLANLTQRSTRPSIGRPAPLRGCVPKTQGNSPARMCGWAMRKFADGLD